jgi:hypothetical protein
MQFFQQSGDAINNSFQNIWAGSIAFIPNLIVAIVIFILGWIVASLVARVIVHIIKAIKLDNALEQAGLGAVVKRSGVTLDSGAFVGGIVKWFIIVAFLVASLDVLGLSQVNLFLREVVLGYIPNVLVAVLILLVSVVLADVVSKIVVGSSSAAGVKSANFLGTVTRWSIWIFALLAALVQLGIAGGFIQTIFTGIVVALSLAFGLSFGLGGQQAAAGYIEKIKQEIADRKHN